MVSHWTWCACWLGCGRAVQLLDALSVALLSLLCRAQVVHPAAVHVRGARCVAPSALPCPSCCMSCMLVCRSGRMGCQGPTGAAGALCCHAAAAASRQADAALVPAQVCGRGDRVRAAVWHPGDPGARLVASAASYWQNFCVAALQAYASSRATQPADFASPAAEPSTLGRAQIKRRAPKAHTVVELVRKRWGHFAAWTVGYVCMCDRFRAVLAGPCSGECTPDTITPVCCRLNNLFIWCAPS